MKVTKRAAVVRGLECLGFRPSFARKTRKYLVLARAGTELLIGRSGGVRKVSEGGAIARSISLTDTPTHRILEQLGRDSEIVRSEGEQLQRWAELQFARLAREFGRCQPV